MLSSKKSRIRFRLALFGLMILVFLIGSANTLAPATAQIGGSYDLPWFTVDSNRSIEGGTYQINGSVGQPDASSIQSGGQFELSGGFAGGFGQLALEGAYLGKTLQRFAD